MPNDRKALRVGECVNVHCARRVVFDVLRVVALLHVAGVAVCEVEEDRTVYGDEVKFGGGKVIRDGMGQSQTPRAEGAVDTVITNALILDWWGIVKADVGLKDGRIVGIGKAGNPDTQEGVTIVVGPGTEAIAGEGHILTAGGIDTHIHFICPQQIETALASGVTTLMGGGTGPATGTNATTCTPGAFHIGRMLQAAEGLPVNLGFFGKGNASTPEALEEQVRAGACLLYTSPSPRDISGSRMPSSA